jgi:nucleoside-diphosphate-sugar epimerase
MLNELQGDCEIRAAVRKKNFFYEGVKTFFVGDINSQTAWEDSLEGVDILIHLAGINHHGVIKDLNLLRRMWDVNVEGVINLANQALKYKVKRFIFLSSISVNGSNSFDGKFTETSTPSPTDYYAESKLAAENALKMIFQNSHTELVIIRPPAVYGPRSPKSFLFLAKLISNNFIFPFSLICNHRCYISIGNLTDFIITCCNNKSAANELFLISDGLSISTKRLIFEIGLILNKKIFMFPFPIFLQKLILNILGLGFISPKLFDDLQIDNSKAYKILNWRPKGSFHNDLAKVFYKSNSSP